MAGISDLKDVVRLACAAIEGGMLIVADGKVNFSDLAHVMDIIAAAGPAFVGIENVKAQYLDIDSAEKLELNKLVEDELDLSNDVVETYVEKVFEVLFLVGDLISLKEQ